MVNYMQAVNAAKGNNNNLLIRFSTSTNISSSDSINLLYIFIHLYTCSLFPLLLSHYK